MGGEKGKFVEMDRKGRKQEAAWEQLFVLVAMRTRGV